MDWAKAAQDSRNIPGRAFLGIPAERHVLLALVWIKTLKNPGTLYSNT